MNSRQRRLDALDAAVAPCGGCLVENMHAAEMLLESEVRGEVIWQIEAKYSREIDEPQLVLDWSDEERQARSDAYQAEMNRLDKRLRFIAGLPLTARRDSCPECIPRKRLRERAKLPWRLRLDFEQVDWEPLEAEEQVNESTGGRGSGIANGVTAATTSKPR